MRVALPLVLTVAAACLDPFEPPVGTTRLAPPSIYSTLWQAVETCSGIHGEFARVRWFAVPETPFRCGEVTCVGLWKAPHDVYLGADVVNDSLNRYFTVRHEMLHDLIHGGYDHPPVFEHCGLIRVDIGGG